MDEWMDSLVLLQKRENAIMPAPADEVFFCFFDYLALPFRIRYLPSACCVPFLPQKSKKQNTIGRNTYRTVRNVRAPVAHPSLTTNRTCLPCVVPPVGKVKERVRVRRRSQDTSANQPVSQNGYRHRRRTSEIPKHARPHAGEVSRVEGPRLARGERQAHAGCG